MITRLPDRVFVVEERPNPSTDFFIRPWLQGQGAEPEFRGFDQTPEDSALVGAAIVFVRYVPQGWRKALARSRSQVRQIYYFMDDDLFERSSHAGMPLRYQLKLYRHATRHQRWLRAMQAKLLVSVPYLAEKYAAWEPELLDPSPVQLPTKPPVTLFYHGSTSHADEMRWLLPVVEEVQHRDQDLVFELIGDRRANRLFRGLPRVHVWHPMQWTSYRSLLSRPGYSIGLAPLLDSRFNRARSYTKFFDITQAGAAGIYAEGPVYGRIVKHGENGLLLPMVPETWVDGILELARDPAYRQRLHQRARASLG